MRRRKQTLILIFLFFLLVAVIFFVFKISQKEENILLSEEKINLPEPRKNSSFSLERAINERRSVREYADREVTLAEVSQLLWAAQGLTSEVGRTAPSAGGLYPLELYLVGSFGGYENGIYHYLPLPHSLERIKTGDFRAELAKIGLSQTWIEAAPLNIVITGVVSRTEEKYGTRAEQYVALEAGHVGQNIYLQATALGLGTVSIGAFDDDKMAELFSFAESQKAYYIFPVGGRK